MNTIKIITPFLPYLFILAFIGKQKENVKIIDKTTFRIKRIFLIWIFIAIFYLIFLSEDDLVIGLIPYQHRKMLFIFIGLISGFVTLTDSICRWIKYKQDKKPASLLIYLQEMDPMQFENLIEEYFQSLGYRTWLTKSGHDHGVDVVVYDGDGEKWIVQCKRYKGTVGEPILRDLLGVMVHERASQAILMTTGNLSVKAREWIVGKPITVFEGVQLANLLLGEEKSPKLP